MIHQITRRRKRAKTSFLILKKIQEEQHMRISENVVYKI